jgi:F-type H+-transporting ATPase subunit gamma
MSNLKHLKLRIRSVKSTQKITKAMKMVAASKMRRARNRLEQSLAYSNKMKETVSRLAKNVSADPGAPKLLIGNGSNKKHLLVVFTADRGLCGAFNMNAFKSLKNVIKSLQKDGKEITIVTVGNKAIELVKSSYEDKIIRSFEDVTRKNLNFNSATEIAQYLIDLFEKDNFDICSIIYNRFVSAISQSIEIEQLIPATGNIDNIENIEDNNKSIYEYEPKETTLLSKLLPASITVRIFYALLESYASEQAARMTAMDNATRNADDMVKKLTLVYNRTRQAVITKELIEIISGAEALN